MRQALEFDRGTLKDAVDAAVSRLVGVNRLGSICFINLPMHYPDGSAVTVKVEDSAGGFRVSDGGYSYRQAEAVGAERSFRRTANHFIQEHDLDSSSKGSRVIHVDVDARDLFGAICDVGLASWRTVERIYSRLSSVEEDEIAEIVRSRVVEIFGSDRLDEKNVITGSSTSEWDVTAIIRGQPVPTIFQAVSNHPNSIFKAHTAFHDISLLAKAPRLIAVVSDKVALGPRHSLLAQEGYVIEVRQPDDVWRSVA
ncbi:MAG: hypothetical protein VYB54_01420 [Pseudomonadota bacterium]|nr:hypothetical protein [Pseudomonadota bacterium]